MDLRTAQDSVDAWIQAQDTGYWSPLAMMARLAEEVGELAREVNHVYGEKPKKLGEPPADIEGEVGDILFILACMGNSWNIDLSAALERSLAKVTRRDADRWKRASGQVGSEPGA
jgi:NTP pyrophosphatase (non-canonical NTP hydrolase)